MKTVLQAFLFFIWFTLIVCVGFPVALWVFISMTKLLGIN